MYLINCAKYGQNPDLRADLVGTLGTPGEAGPVPAPVDELLPSDTATAAGTEKVTPLVSCGSNPRETRFRGGPSTWRWTFWNGMIQTDIRERIARGMALEGLAKFEPLPETVSAMRAEIAETKNASSSVPAKISEELVLKDLGVEELFD